MSRDDYEPGYRCPSTVPPADTVLVRCDGCHECREMPVERGPGYGNDHHYAVCRCEHKHDLYDDQRDCGGCGCRMDPERLMECAAGEKLCLRCRDAEWQGDKP